MYFTPASGVICRPYMGFSPVNSSRSGETGPAREDAGTGVIIRRFPPPEDYASAGIMLQQLCIRNFTIIEELLLEIGAGLTVISGETGAGKSILVDALQLALGGRAEGVPVRPGADRAEISACFSVTELPEARQWLQEREFAAEDGSCVLRRLLGRDGRSRAYINGRPVPLRELQALGEHLAGIHGQHAQLALLQRHRQLALLDDFGTLQEPLQTVRELALRWRAVRAELQELESAGSSPERLELLDYQLRELRQLALEEGEIQTLEEEHRRLASADQLLRNCGETLELCGEEEAAAGELLRRGVKLLEEAARNDKRLQEALELLQSASQMLQEGLRSLGRYAGDFDNDPEKLAAAERRLEAVEQAARRHRVRSVELPAEQRRLEEEYQHLQHGGERRKQCEEELQSLQEQYRTAAAQLRRRRLQQAARLNAKVNQHLQALGMEHCRFTAELQEREEETPQPEGSETVIFQAATNPGHPAAPLEQIASGGELSRIGLALQVAALGHSPGLCLVFDEVDSGVGSSAADHVGDMLYRLGAQGQALCVTHLAQVAGRADLHLVAEKCTTEDSTRAGVRGLDGEEERVEELARLLAGKKISVQARKHAREILQEAQKGRR